jgi:hypothetical protein
MLGTENILYVGQFMEICPCPSPHPLPPKKEKKTVPPPLQKVTKYCTSRAVNIEERFNFV